MKKLIALLAAALSSVTLHAQGVWIEENIDPNTGLRTGRIEVNGGTYTIGPEANLGGANLSGADLRDARLSGADLSFAILSGADLSGADLSAANLSAADLSAADLSDANLNRAAFLFASLDGVDLSWANLIGANLLWANLSGANLFAADFMDGSEDRYVGMLLSAVSKGNYDEIQALKPQVETNTTEIAELKTMMEAMSVQMQQLNARLDDQQASIEEKDQQIAELSQRPTLAEVQDARAGSLVFRADEETNSVTLEFEIQSSENLQDWVAQPEKVTATVPLDAEKKFVRIALAQERTAFQPSPPPVDTDDGDSDR